MDKLLLYYLSWLARRLIKKHNPYIIGITGTAGKTTMTHNIACFLRAHFGEQSVEISKYNYNGEFGFPLSIIGARTGGKNIFRWIAVGVQACMRLFRPYPRYLILEYGIDHPGEMDFLLSIAVPDIAIVTPIEPNHIEQFKKFENYKKEKLKIIAYAKKSIVHSSLSVNLPVGISTYGFDSHGDIQIESVSISTQGTDATIRYKDHTYQVLYPSIGLFHIENLLPIIYICEKMHINPDSIRKGMKSMKVRKGRGTLLNGIKNSCIIDASYNGGYLSIREGIFSLKGFLGSKDIILVLGDMRELGTDEASLHTKLAHDILNTFQGYENIKIYLVGPMMQKYIFPILSDVFDVKSSLSSKEIGKYIQENSQGFSSDTVLYVKGSQNTIFLEEAIKYWIDESDTRYLPRQDQKWMKIKEAFFSHVKEGLKT